MPSRTPESTRYLLLLPFVCRTRLSHRRLAQIQIDHRGVVPPASSQEDLILEHLLRALGDHSLKTGLTVRRNFHRLIQINHLIIQINPNYANISRVQIDCVRIGNFPLSPKAVLIQIHPLASARKLHLRQLPGRHRLIDLQPIGTIINRVGTVRLNEDLPGI